MRVISPQLEAQVRSWLGSKYHHQGRLKKSAAGAGGVDCIGLIIGVIDELGLQDGNGTRLSAHDEFNYSMHQERGRQVVRAVDQVTINLPIVMGATQAKQVADITLYGTWKERLSFSLTVPPKYVRLEPTDVITVTVSGVAHEMRVVKTDMESGGLMKISAVAEDVSSYDFYTPPGETSRNITPPVLVPETLVQFVDAPPLPSDTVQSQGLLRTIRQVHQA
jgi:hypothetical protein